MAGGEHNDQSSALLSEKQKQLQLQAPLNWSERGRVGKCGNKEFEAFQAEQQSKLSELQGKFDAARAEAEEVKLEGGCVLHLMGSQSGCEHVCLLASG